MDHTFHFTASRFNTTERRDYFINDCCFGEDVVAWLRERLLATATEADIGEAIQEDYGWGFWVDVGDDNFWTYASLATEDAPTTTNCEWVLGIHGREPIFVWRRDSRVRRLSRFDALVSKIRAAISSEEGLVLLSEEDD